MFLWMFDFLKLYLMFVMYITALSWCHFVTVSLVAFIWINSWYLVVGTPKMWNYIKLFQYKPRRGQSAQKSVLDKTSFQDPVHQSPHIMTGIKCSRYLFALDRGETVSVSQKAMGRIWTHANTSMHVYCKRLHWSLDHRHREDSTKQLMLYTQETTASCVIHFFNQFGGVRYKNQLTTGSSWLHSESSY